MSLAQTDFCFFSAAQMSDSHMKVDHEQLSPPRPFQEQLVMSVLSLCKCNLGGGRGGRLRLPAEQTSREAGGLHWLPAGCFASLSPPFGEQSVSSGLAGGTTELSELTRNLTESCSVNVSLVTCPRIEVGSM